MRRTLDRLDEGARGGGAYRRPAHRADKDASFERRGDLAGSSSPAGSESGAGARHVSGVQSVEIGMAVLATLARQPVSPSLAELARACGMTATKTFRYLNSLERARYVERDRATACYRLGANSLQLGLAALAETDFVRVGSQRLPSLCRDLGETVFLSTWSRRGALIVRWEEADRAINVSFRTGSTLPLLRSATGRVYGAHLPASSVAEALESELAAGEGRAVGVGDAAGAHALFAGVRKAGMASVDGLMLPGVGAIASPVFDWGGKLAGAITTLGLLGAFDVQQDGSAARTLRSWAARLSHRLGAPSAG